ncbi:MAG: hypothetical protein SGILL_007903, partial [Bacillariaceae sp.]
KRNSSNSSTKTGSSRRRSHTLKLAYQDSSGALSSTKKSKSATNNNNHDDAALEKHRRLKSIGRSRKDRVLPVTATATSSRMEHGGAVVQNGKTTTSESSSSYKNKKPDPLTTDEDNNTNGSSSSDEDEHRAPRTHKSSSSTPKGLRGTRDLRSPGVQKTPVAAQAAKLPASGAPIPDFITQTDASGNATTPRSQQAIEGARKVHPSGPKPHLHVDQDGKLTEDDDGNDDSDGSKDIIDEACVTMLDSLRLMCCCLMPPEMQQPCLTQKSLTEDSDDKSRVKLLGPLHPHDTGKPCLVLDLDETLVHSSFRAVPGADFVIPVQIEDVVHFVYVMKRPGVDEFLVEMSKHYEIVIYTASLNKYADPLLDLLDPHKTIRARLFRESCVFYEGNYVKDLSLLDRDLTKTIIIDNSPSSYMFHPENAIDCSSFIDDPRDRELDQIGDFLKGISRAKDVRYTCTKWRDWPAIGPIEEEHPEQAQ